MNNKKSLIAIAVAGLVLVLGVVAFSLKKHENKPGNTEPATTLSENTAPMQTAQTTTEPQVTLDPNVIQSPTTANRKPDEITMHIVPATTTEPQTGDVNPDTTAPTTTEPPTDVISEEEMGRFTKLLNIAGFQYDAAENIFYTIEDPWQRNLGYSELYDMFASFGQMIFDTERFIFDYEGRQFMIQIWKGRYVFTTGCEIGIYEKTDGNPNSDFFTPVGSEDYIELEYNLYHFDKFYIHKGPMKHWWLTGFRVGDTFYSDELNMQAFFFIKDKGFADAFEKALKDKCGDALKYKRDADTIIVYWGPHLSTIWPELS